MIATATIIQSNFDFIADGPRFSLPLTRFVLLHSDPLALRAPPFSLPVVDVPFEFPHGDFTVLAGHDVPFVSMIALPNFQ
jgi:hypothetical protein